MRALRGGWMRFVWFLGWCITGSYVYIFHGLRARGTENIPPGGPLIFTSNHQSFLDPIILSVPRCKRIRFMAQGYLFRIPILSQLIQAVGTFPVDPGMSLKKSFEKSLQVLEEGGYFGIFPEGGRGKDEGSVQAFQDGVARISVRMGVPIVPATITGGVRAWPHGQWLPTPSRIAITYHPPIHPGEGSKRERIAAVMARLQETITPRLGPYSRFLSRVDQLYKGPSSPIRLQEIVPFLLGAALLGSWKTSLAAPLPGVLAAYAAYLMADLILLRPGRAWKFLRDASPILVLGVMHPYVSAALPAMGGGLLPLAGILLAPGLQASWSGQRAGCRWVLGIVLGYTSGVLYLMVGAEGVQPGWAVLALVWVVFHVAHSVAERRIQARWAVAGGLLLGGILVGWVIDRWGMGDLGFLALTGVALFAFSRLLPSRRRGREYRLPDPVRRGDSPPSSTA
ncbi:MAG: lysophospholipid acyltransferase family protein [Planctomycetota bacterium]|nr:lysophospholipid acyltransferase family protein [Planctomycetota bacterium]